ncbi:hypothetical protein [Ferroglobus placidus]|uniref:hypothetical protein n=1 Tax=Ferroglobus placidus TaxID=54261 RepID=UPI00064EEAC2|nr:hypothetical protein [Ferroglobus placidus]
MGVVDGEKAREYKPTLHPFVSIYRKHGDDLVQEFVYTSDGWVPTWRLPTRENLRKIEDGEDVDAVFTVLIREGSLIKRVIKHRGRTVTKLFIFTRFGLLEQEYEYRMGTCVIGKKSGSYFALKTGLRVEERDHVFWTQE